MPEQRKRRIYILLTQSETICSKIIRRFTGDTYTHASIAFEEDLNSFYSFARRYPALPFPAGFVREHLDEGFFERHRDIPCVLYAMGVTEPVYERARDRIASMFVRRRTYRYNLRGLALCQIGIEESRPKHYFCSQFVGEILRDSGAVVLPKPPSLMRPQDYEALPGLLCLFRGRVSGLAAWGAARFSGVMYPRHGYTGVGYRSPELVTGSP